MVSDDGPTLREDWDFYADPSAIARYIDHRDQGASRNSLLEEPDFLALLGDVGGRRCLDLGCGYGHYSELLARQGATVVGVDRSSLMLAEARGRNTTAAVEYRLANIDDVDFPEQSYDLVVSNLTFHYLPDPVPLFGRIRRWLRPGGRLVFSVEHPVYTAGRDRQLWCEEDQEHRRWVVSDYFDEGDRWGYFGRKFHHTVATWIDTPLRCGFTLNRVVEPRPAPPTVATAPSLAEDLHRPLFLLVSCIKPERSHG